MKLLWMSLWLMVAQAENTSTDGIESGVALSEAPLLDPPTDSEVEQRTYDLGKILRCPVCQGLSVADSQSDAAVAMKNRIQELVTLGYSDDQIIDYFIGRYGEFVLLQPKSEHWFVWWMPLIGLAVGAGVIAVRWNSSDPSPMEPTSSDNIDLETQKGDTSNTDKYRAQLLAELED